MKPTSNSRLLDGLALFGSLSTLVCCALPALLVSLGLGAVMASVANTVPGLVWMSENKALVFGVTFVMLAGNALYLYSQRNAPCPIDPRLRAACLTGRTWSVRVLYFSVFAYALGSYFAFVAPRL